MLKLTQLNKNYFNHQLLKFRIQYYFSETKELIARHNLLTAFIICLLAPGVKNIQAIGIPFYALIDPSITFKAKIIYLIALLFFLLCFTKAQSSFIKGGEFRDYLRTLYIPSAVHKKVDFIILLLSLNIIWVAIFFGGANIVRTEDTLFQASQYCLYVSSVFVVCTLLLNFLYKKITKGMINVSSLILIIVISKQGNSLLNFSLGLSLCLLCGIILSRVQPYQREQKYSFKIPYFTTLNSLKSFNALSHIFIIQLAIIKKNQMSFLIRFSICFAISQLILHLFNSGEMLANQFGILLFLTGLETYILSTLFTLFEKGKLEHTLFHSIFPYQKNAQPIKEIVLIWIGFMLTIIPVCIFFIVSLKNGFLLSLNMFIINGVVFALNRILYALSLRFCLFSALLNTVGCYVLQYIFLGAYYGC